MVRESSTLWQKHSIQSRFYSKPDRPLDTYVVLLPAQGLNEPDLLLYWVYQRTAGKRSAWGGATSGCLYHGQGLSSSAEWESALAIWSCSAQLIRLCLTLPDVEKLP